MKVWFSKCIVSVRSTIGLTVFQNRVVYFLVWGGAACGPLDSAAISCNAVADLHES
jgi:hypothetical protein